MISEFREFYLDSGKGNIKARVNWNDSDEVKNCETIEFQVKKEKFWIKRSDLVAFLMVIGTQDDIKNLLPMKLSKVRRYETILEFEWKASRDIRKGEKVTVRAPHVVSLPVEDEIFSGNIETRYKHKKGVISPNSGLILKK